MTVSPPPTAPAPTGVDGPRRVLDIDGVQVTLYLRPGQMGIFGKDVQAK